MFSEGMFKGRVYVFNVVCVHVSRACLVQNNFCRILIHKIFYGIAKIGSIIDFAFFSPMRASYLILLSLISWECIWLMSSYVYSIAW
jgi:hypothetical protein